MIVLPDEIFNDYRHLCKEQWGVKIVEKTESRLMKVLAAVLFFNKNFMNGYVTTIGRTVYWPSAGKLSGKDFETLFHEAQHACDFTQNPCWFISSYLSPQSTALLAAGALLALVGSPLWLLSLLFLLMLAPLPSPMRTHWELRGYACNMACALWTQGYVPAHDLQRIRDDFTSCSYYFMWPFPSSMDEKLEQAQRDIRTSNLTSVQDETARFLVHHGIIEQAT